MHEAEGDLTANAFASCLTDYLENLEDGIKEVVMFSDGCTYQNGNVVLANALLNIPRDRKLLIV